MMGIVSRIRPQARLSDYIEQKIIEIYGGYSTSAGVSINSESAMRLITVQNCVRVRAATIAQLPCHIMERTGNMRNKAEDFYLYEKLHDQPNSWMTASEFWGMAEAHICLRGNFYAYKLGLPGRDIQQLVPIKADQMEKVEQKEDYSLVYHVRLGNGEAREIPQEKIFHLRGLTLNGFMGINPIQYARETLGVGSAGTSFIGKYFSKGMHPGVVFKHPLPLSAPAHANLRENLKKKYEGLGTSWEMMLVDENMTVEFPTIKLVDAQYLELMKMNEAQICGLFRVPLMLIQSGDKTPTYASAEQFMISYSVYGVTPDVVNYEKAIRRDLLTPEERKRYYAKFSIDGLLRGDFKTRMEGFQIGVNTEIINPNEARELLDMNPYEGGDEYRTRTSTVKQAAEAGGKGAQSET